jgi:hypothetical protein
MGGDVALSGSENLRKAFAELGDMSSSEWKKTLRAAVRTPAKQVVNQAVINIGKISPGKAKEHLTYRNNVVSAGFASRSIRMKIKIDPKKGVTTAFIGVLKEAFYAISFFELGLPSRGIAREPWLVPALNGRVSSSVEEVGEALLKCITSIAKRRARASANSAGMLPNGRKG